MNPDADYERLGTVVLRPDGPVVAGSVGQWTLVYTVGAYGIDEGGTIKLTQRFPCDWEVPQFDRPREEGFTTVETSGPARLRVRYDLKGHERPWMHCLVIDIYDGSLVPGDTVVITLGDRRNGSPGIRAQTFQESAHEFRVLVDPTNACVARPLPTSPKVSVIAGPPAGLVCIVPTQGVPGRDIEVFVKGEDKWRNPTPPPEDLNLAWQGTGEPEFEGNILRFSRPGSGWVLASTGGLDCRSNPLTVYETEPEFGKYWGDLHAQSDATVGTGSEEEYFTFGRDWARLDFISHQGNDFQMTDEDWERLNDTTRSFHQSGRFVTFPGFEDSRYGIDPAEPHTVELVERSSNPSVHSGRFKRLAFRSVLTNMGRIKV